MSKKNSDAKQPFLKKCKGTFSNFKQRFPKWKLFAFGIIIVIGVIAGLVIGLWPSNAATTARNGDTVKVSYIGTYDNGSVFDSANSSAPLEFIIGNKSTIPGFEKGVIGMSENQTKTIHVTPDEAYGPSEFTEDISLFPADVAVGQYYSGTLKNGLFIADAWVTAVAVNESTVTLQNLNRMAGKNLNFEITLLALIKAE
jgi:peptidylprolyl isomerase